VDGKDVYRIYTGDLLTLEILVGVPSVMKKVVMQLLIEWLPAVLTAVEHQLIVFSNISPPPSDMLKVR
jgi:hypothetical protein